MGRAKDMPSDELLKKWFLEDELTYPAMVREWEKLSNVRVAPTTMLGKCKDADWYVPRIIRHSGSNLLPWKDIRTEHTDAHDPSMLRKVHARRLGKVFDPDTDKDITAYERGLIEDGCVVHYDRNTIEGWHHVKKKKSDTDLVRLPKGYKAP